MARYEIRTGADMGAALSELRKQLGLSQIDAGVLGGIDPNYISKIESGRSVSLLEHELRIFRRLGASVVVEFPDVLDE